MVAKIRDDSKGFGIIELLIIVVVVGLLGFGGWYVWNSRHPAANNNSQSSGTTEEEQTASQSATAKTYANDEYGFSFDYQEAWQFIDGSDETLPTLTLRSPDYSTVDKSGLRYIAEGGLVSVTVNKTSSQQFRVVEGEYYFDNCLFGENCLLEYFGYTGSTEVDGFDAITGSCGHNDPGICTYVMRKGKVYGFGYYQPNRNIASDTQTSEDKYLNEYKRLLESVEFSDH